jgi:transcriptional regulator with XRE-family HTH domain
MAHLPVGWATPTQPLRQTTAWTLAKACGLSDRRSAQGARLAALRGPAGAMVVAVVLEAAWGLLAVPGAPVGDADGQETELTYLGGIERGRRNPSVAVVGRIAGVLGVHPRQLFDEVLEAT